jgi:ferredoxin
VEAVKAFASFFTSSQDAWTAAIDSCQKKLARNDGVRGAHATIGEASKTLRRSGYIFLKAAEELTNMEKSKDLIGKMLVVHPSTRSIIAHHMKGAADGDEFRGAGQWTDRDAAMILYGCGQCVPSCLVCAIMSRDLKHPWKLLSISWTAVFLLMLDWGLEVVEVDLMSGARLPWDGSPHLSFLPGTPRASSFTFFVNVRVW